MTSLIDSCLGTLALVQAAPETSPRWLQKRGPTGPTKVVGADPPDTYHATVNSFGDRRFPKLLPRLAPGAGPRPAAESPRCGDRSTNRDPSLSRISLRSPIGVTLKLARKLRGPNGIAGTGRGIRTGPGIARLASAISSLCMDIPRDLPRVNGRPRLLAVAAAAPWPIMDGYSLRVQHILEGLATDWDITVLAPPMDDESEWPLRDRIAYVPVDVEHRWARLAFSAADRARLRDRVRRAMDELDPVAMLLWNGTEFVSFELPTPGVVVDRIDCIGLMAWRSRLETTHPVEKLRAVRKAYRFARYEREVVRSADVTVVVSDDDAAALRRVSGSRDVRVIPNGVTLQPRDGNQEQAGRPTVIFTGGIGVLILLTGIGRRRRSAFEAQADKDDKESAS